MCVSSKAELTKVKEACQKMRIQQKDDETQVELLTKTYKDGTCA